MTNSEFAQWITLINQNVVELTKQTIENRETIVQLHAEVKRLADRLNNAQNYVKVLNYTT